MYYREKYDKNYIFKILILLLAAVVGEVAIWWAMVREDSVDWISAQIVHQASPYAIGETEDGRTIVSNVVQNFEITLPYEFKAIGSRQPIFYLEEGGEQICYIKSEVVSSEKKVDALKNEDKALIEIRAGSARALAKEANKEGGGFIYELLIPLNRFMIKYSLAADEQNKNRCKYYMGIIKASFISY